MKDQVDRLQQRGIAATCINSTVSIAEQQERLHQLAAGQYDLVYLAPERFRSPAFRDTLKQTRVQLLAIDEAHCISEWGHDFRHDYARLGQFRRELGSPQTIALTATATEDVRRDILQQLGLEPVRTFMAGFARDNLSYEVRTVSAKRDKEEALLELVQQQEGVGIVYVATRKLCTESAQLLTEELGERVLAYHGGMAGDDRRRIQESFMNDEARVVVATNAFGMGIDKADVRFVVHYNMPGTLEAYYQEAGRAGRDGQPSRCILLYSASDRYLQEYFLENNYPPRDTVALVYNFLRSRREDPIELTQEQLKDELNLSLGAEGVGTCERLLEKAGVLRRLEPNRNMAAIRLDSDVTTLVELLPPQATTQRKVARALERLMGDRRYETVYFSLQRLVGELGMEQAAVTRSLRELQRRWDGFDYVPPFRGRAVHMLRSDVGFEELGLDFSELEARREAAYEKLDRVVKFGRSQRKCREQMILEYFGDPAAEPCGRCDNCRAGRVASRRAQAAAAAVDTPPADGTPQPAVNPNEAALSSEQADHHQLRPVEQVVVKTLSGIARCKSRFGKQMVVGMLCGSRSAKITRWKLDQLTTFGLLGFLRQTEVGEIIDLLTSEGLVETVDVDRFRPVVQLTEYGTEVMAGRQHVTVAFALHLRAQVPALWKLPATPSATPPATPATPGVTSAGPAQPRNRRPPVT